MKIKFNPDLTYQREAIESITGIFEGQETCQTNFTVPKITHIPQMEFDDPLSHLGTGNKLELLPEEILENVRRIQLHRGLKQSTSLGSMDFTVEMETGTGKTYVYLRTVFEMHKRYGFTKFIIVVPSIAVKEGVFKSLQITAEHFREHYDNVPCDYFLYDSQKLGQVRNFATSDYIQIMVINIDAFRKSFTDPQKEDKANIIHRANDRMSGNRPIEFIQSTNPIVIIDEPQSVDGTPKSKEAIASLKPLCCLRYSATHREKYNLVYKLDSIDAYDQKLVKQIEVASIQVKDGHNRAYIRLLSVDNRKSPITAKIELDWTQNGQVKRVVKSVRSGDDLLAVSGGRDIYDGYVINDIYCKEGEEYIDFTSKPEVVPLGQAIGEVSVDEFKRLQIRKTIEEHLEKELKLGKPYAIKVLSLFFLDKVANYRYYDDEGNPQKGKFARMFEEEYRDLIQRPKYNTLFENVDTESLPEQVHNGYFAIDKKKDTRGEEQYKESKGDGRTVADEGAYQLIMRDKERLLGFESKLKFIFSHSALKEGWDNPNVFQICTLNETASTMKKRQEIGRGLRIAVNQDGERIYGFEVNTLTVMANESYEDFVKQLQREIEEDEGIKFGVVEKHFFANIVVRKEDGSESYLGAKASEELWDSLEATGYIDKKGKVQDILRSHLKENRVVLPEKFRERSVEIEALLKKISGDLNIKDADNKKSVNLNKAVYLGDEFKALWERIKYKTTYRVEFDVKDLIAKCSEEIRQNLVVGRAKFIYEKGTTVIDRSGVSVHRVQESKHVYEAQDFVLPDIVTYLQNETNLTRKSLVTILTRCGRLEDFKKNPQKFIEEVCKIIQHQMRQFIVDGIKYRKIGEHSFYVQELFENQELVGYLNQNLLESKKSVYDHIVYDSEVESQFARSCEHSSDVKVYAKLPGWFKIETPLGNYNPDWAVLVSCSGQERLFFVVETKGSTLVDMLRPSERAKIDCGREHFKAMGENVGFIEVDTFEKFMDKVAG